MKDYRLIVFDLDDTLFDYAQTERLAVTEACARLGLECREDIYAKYRRANDIVRCGFRDITAENIRAFRIARADAFLASSNRRDVSAEDFVDEYLRNSTAGILIAGVPETLEQLRGISKVVATNGTDYPRRNKLEGSPIATYFDGFFSSEGLGVAKPDPEYFVRILQHCKVRKEEALVVGDSYRLDIETAARLGFDCCWFDYRRAYRDAPLPQAVRLINRFDELISVIGRRVS
jgi:2-haloacid dehalogenase